MESANFPCILAIVLIGERSRLWVSVRSDPKRFPAIYRLLIPLLYGLPDKIVAVSEGVAEALATMGVPEKKLISIPNPAPTHAPVVSIPLPRPIIAPDRYILGVGRLHWQKGFDRLIKAFSRLKDDTLHLVLLGVGQEQHALRLQAEMLGVFNRVHMPGANEDVWSWYRHALCFVLSSRLEGWPNVLMEAMSNGCPVVSFNCDYGPSEIIEHGVNGLLVDEGDVHALEKTITQLLSDNELSDRLVKQGLKRAAEFHVSKLAMSWITEI